MTWDWLVQRTGKYCSIRGMEYPEFQTGIFGRMESAHSNVTEIKTVFFNFFIYLIIILLVSVISLVSVVSVVSFRSFRSFRFGRFVSLFRVLVHAT